MFVTRHHDRSLLRWIGVALYAAFLLVAQFEHHDLVCHLKTPQHCTSCTSSPLGSHAHAPASPGASHLTDAGCVLIFHVAPQSALFAVRTTGRSPPTLA